MKRALRFLIALRFVAALSIVTVTETVAIADDWPQWRGPNQDGISKEKINITWPAGGPKRLWKVPFPGAGSFAVAAQGVFGLTRRDINGNMREVCVALDASTGKELWAADITAARPSSNASAVGAKRFDGPRSTPVVTDGRVYAYSTDAILCCFDAATGKELWRVDVLTDHAGAGREPKWGNASSPVVEGDLIMVAGGGQGQAILGLDRKTGKVVWKTGDQAFDYNTTPLVATIHGQRQAIFNLGHNLVGVSVKDGKLVWRKGVAWDDATAWSPQPQPIVSENKVWYGSDRAGCALFEIVKWEEGFRGKWIWDMNIGHWNLPYSTPILSEGHLYGMCGKNPAGNFSGGDKPVSDPAKVDIQLRCLKLATAAGNRPQWAQKGFGGDDRLILVGDKLVVLSGSGEIILVEAGSDASREASRFKALDGPCCSEPAFSNGRLYIRSRTEGACLDMGNK